MQQALKLVLLLQLVLLTATAWQLQLVTLMQLL
jgi:hypothetical protein